MNGSTCAQRPTASNRSAALPSSSTGIICGGRIRRSAGEHRTRLTSANQWRRRRWPPDAMPSRCCEFVDSRLRRSPPDRASAVPYGQAGENAVRFPHLTHRSAAAHKLHSTPQQDRMNLIRGRVKPAAGYRGPLAYSSPKAVQTTGTVAHAETMSNREIRSPLNFLTSRAGSLREVCDEIGPDGSAAAANLPPEAPVQGRVPPATAAGGMPLGHLQLSGQT